MADRLQYQRIAEVHSTLDTRVYFDGWYRPISEPLFDHPENRWAWLWTLPQNIEPIPEPVALDHWFRPTEQPLFDVPNSSWTYQTHALHVEPLGSPPEEITLDKWFAPTQQPLFERRSVLPYLGWYDIDGNALDPPPLPNIDWHPPIQQPLFDYDRRQWLYPPTSIIAPPYTPENYSGAYLGTVYIIPSYLADVRVMPSYAASIRTVP